MSRKKIISDWFYEYSHDVYNFLVYYTGVTDVEDLVQEVFIKAIKGYSRYKGHSAPKTWLFSIARNVAIDEMRKNKRRNWKLSTINKDNQGQRFEQTPEKIFETNEELKDLFTSIHELKNNYRDVLILRGIKECSVAETAEILNWSAEKVRTTYHRAIKALRKRHGGNINE